MRKIVAVTAGLGTPSTSRLLTDAITESISQQLLGKDMPSSIETYELRKYAVDIANNMTNGYASPNLAPVIKSVEESDILIAATPVFTAGMSGLFKSFFDVMDNTALTGKIVVIGATGGSARHSLVLDYGMRPMFAYLKADVTPTGLFASPEDWGSADTSLSSRVGRAAEEAVSRLEGMIIRKPDDSMESLPFEQLLANVTRGK